MDYSSYIQREASKSPVQASRQDAGSTGKYEPPAEGPCLLRLVGYIEVGKRNVNYMGQQKDVEKVKLVFEVFGPKYEPRKIGDELVPIRVTVLENLSMFERSNFRKKLFEPMRNGDPGIKHMAQMLGKPFRGHLYHKQTGAGRTIATLQNPTTKDYTIGPPVFSDPVSGETRTLEVPPAVSPLRCFIWDQADKKMWDSIYIPGTTGNRSNNIFQEDIKQAVNYKGSHVQRIAEGGDDGAALEDFLEAAPELIAEPYTEDPFGMGIPQAEHSAPEPSVPAQSNTHFSGRFRR